MNAAKQGKLSKQTHLQFGASPLSPKTSILFYLDCVKHATQNGTHALLLCVSDSGKAVPSMRTGAASRVHFYNPPPRHCHGAAVLATCGWPQPFLASAPCLANMYAINRRKVLYVALWGPHFGDHVAYSMPRYSVCTCTPWECSGGAPFHHSPAIAGSSCYRAFNNKGRLHVSHPLCAQAAMVSQGSCALYFICGGYGCHQWPPTAAPPPLQSRTAPCRPPTARRCSNSTDLVQSSATVVAAASCCPVSTGRVMRTPLPRHCQPQRGSGISFWRLYL